MTKLIASAAYVSPEISAEYGLLPPAFLPVGHKRLYELQVEQIEKQPGPIFLSIPESYSISSADEVILKGHGVTIILVPEGLMLGESLLYSLIMIGGISDPIHILYGDTLINDPPSDRTDIVSVGRATDTYKWGILSDIFVRPDNLSLPHPNYSDTVISGYFSFSNPHELLKSLVRMKYNFLAAIDDYQKYIAIEYWCSPDWLDFGHLQTFYRSRCQIRTQRSFNHIEIDFNMVEKSSSNIKKINSEEYWYKNIPPALQFYTPAYLGCGHNSYGYRTEYLPLPSLHELFVFGCLSEKVWRVILGSCFKFMNDCSFHSRDLVRNETIKPVISQLTLEKTMSRLALFEKEIGLNRDAEWRYEGRRTPSLRRIAQCATEMIDNSTTSFLGLMHGDFCFTNIFFDFRTEHIKVIDPRGGITIESPSTLGDIRYDMAKLAHSAIGGYDLILAGRASWEGFEQRDVKIEFPQNSIINNLHNLFNEFDVLGMKLSDSQVFGIMIHLFLSMIPLHADRPDRQKAFLTNAIRLFVNGAH